MKPRLPERVCHLVRRRILSVSARGAVVLAGTGIVSGLSIPERRGKHSPLKVGRMTLWPAPGSASNREFASLPVVRIWYPVTARSNPSADGRSLPIVLYFPGWPGDVVDNVVLLRFLATQGYLVAAAEYPKGFDGGSRRPFLDFSSTEQFQNSVRQNEESVRSCAKDAGSILDRLLTLNATHAGAVLSPLEIRRVGILGFSFGGAVAAEACRMDQRFIAAVNLDGLHFGASAETGVKQAYFFIGDGAPLPTDPDPKSADRAVDLHAKMVRRDYSRTAKNIRCNGGYLAVMAGSRHENFSDIALRFSFGTLSDRGLIDAERAHDIIRTYVGSFFGKYLKGLSAPLLTGNSPVYPEISLYAQPHPKSGSPRCADNGKGMSSATGDGYLSHRLICNRWGTT